MQQQQTSSSSSSSSQGLSVPPPLPSPRQRPVPVPVAVPVPDQTEVSPEKKLRMPDTLTRTSTFPLSRILPEPPLYGPGPALGLGLGGRYSTGMEIGGPSGKPRMVSGGSRGLGDLLNGVEPRREPQYGDHEHEHDHGNSHRRERVLSPRSRAGQGYQTNDHTGLPSPDNFPPLLPVSRPQPRMRSRSPGRVHRSDRGRGYVFTHHDEDPRHVGYSNTLLVSVSVPVRASEEINSRPGSSGNPNQTIVKAETPNPDSPASENKPQKKRTRLNPEQSGLLKQVWRETCFPSTERRGWLADQTGLSVRQVQVWFQNQRQKQRNEEYEASKAFSADAPHPLSGPRVAFDGPIAPRDLPDKVYHAQGWSSMGPDLQGGKRRASGERPGTASSLGRPGTGDLDRGLGSEGGSRSGSRSGTGSRNGEGKESTRLWNGGAVELPPVGSMHSGPPPMQRTIWDQLTPPPPQSAARPEDPHHARTQHKRQREEDTLERERPSKMYRPAAPGHPMGSPRKEGGTRHQYPRLPSIRELGLSADRQAAMSGSGRGAGTAMGMGLGLDRGLPGIPGMMGLLSGPGRP